MDWHGLVSITQAQAKERGRADVHRNFYAQVSFDSNFWDIFVVFEPIKANKGNIYYVHILKSLQNPRNST